MGEVKTIKLSELKLDPRNANKGTERGREMLEKSIQELGLGRSVVVDKNNVLIAGNKSWQVAGNSGLENALVIETSGDKLVVVKRTDLDLATDDKAKKLAIADNRVGQISLEFDPEVLEQLSQEIDLGDYFTDDELENLINGNAEDEEPEEEDPEEIEDLVDKAEGNNLESRVNLGEVWQLGRHYIACGDSTDEDNINKLLGFVGDRVPDMVWADPPYGIAIQNKNGAVGSKKGKNKNKLCDAKDYPLIANDDTTETAENALKVYLEMFPQSVHAWWGGNHYMTPPSSCWIVWDKKTEKGDIDGIDFADAELAWTNQKTVVRVFRHLWLGAWKQSENGETRVHATQKPVALAEFFFEKYGAENDLIIDPFLGSGISIIAAQKMKGDRTVAGFELSEQYCEVICKRWESLTGDIAELAGRLD